jgi:hypothetical protein
MVPAAKPGRSNLRLTLKPGDAIEVDGVWTLTLLHLGPGKAAISVEAPRALGVRRVPRVPRTPNVPAKAPAASQDEAAAMQLVSPTKLNP